VLNPASLIISLGMSRPVAMALSYLKNGNEITVVKNSATGSKAVVHTYAEYDIR